MTFSHESRCVFILSLLCFVTSQNCGEKAREGFVYSSLDLECQPLYLNLILF